MSSFVNAVAGFPTLRQRRCPLVSRGRVLVPIRATKTFVDHTASDVGVDFGVEVFPVADDVSIALCKTVENAAAAAISTKGVFSLAVPGGSVLKMLSPLSKRKNMDWSKTWLYYVNHKAVAVDDALSTSFKAKGLFLDAVGAVPEQVFVLKGSDNAAHEAEAYELSIRKGMEQLAISADKSGTPVFDLMLLGMGTDGHVGSLYPNRPEIAVNDKFVVPVVKGSGPASITLSLPLMNAATHVVIAMVGEKKAQAVRTALEDAKGGFPAQKVKPKKLTWLLDKGAASALSASKPVAEIGV